MKFSYNIVALAAITAPVFAQIPGIPSCAVDCALGALPSSCPVTNFTCICEDSSFLTGLEPCVETACSPSDQTSALSGAVSLCASAGVTISVPPPTPPPAAMTTSSSSSVPGTISSSSSLASNSTVTTASPTAFTGAAAPQAEGLVPGALLAGAGFLLALF